MSTTRLPNLDPFRLQELFFRVGLCLWQIQSFEYTLSQYLVFVHEYEPAMARTEVHGLFEQAERKTLGRLVQELRRKNPPADTIFLKTEQFVEKRNWLVHRSRIQNHTDLYSPEKYESLLARITDITDESLYLNKAYGSELENFFNAHGLSSERIDILTQKLVDSWASS